MKYFIIEGSPDGAFNATNKAREDVEVILKREGIEPFHINTVSGIQKNKLMKWKQFLDYKKNYRTWDKALSEFKEGQKVFHRKFGEGIINNLEQEGEDLKLDINFDKFGHKRLMARFANLEII